MGGQKEKLKPWQADAVMALLDPNATMQVSMDEFERFMQAPHDREGLQEEVQLL